MMNSAFKMMNSAFKMMNFVLKSGGRQEERLLQQGYWFVFRILYFVFKMIDFAFKMMDFAFKMMDFAFKMMDFVLKMMNFAGREEGSAETDTLLDRSVGEAKKGACSRGKGREDTGKNTGEICRNI